MFAFYLKLTQSKSYFLFNRSIGTFARALDTSSASKESSLHLSAAAASRDITLVMELKFQKYSLKLSFTVS